MEDKIYSSGFNYESGVKKYTAGEISESIIKWSEEEVRAAFVALASIHYPADWPERKTEIEKGFDNGKK